jgi:hypothetical protein
MDFFNKGDFAGAGTLRVACNAPMAALPAAQR